MRPSVRVETPERRAPIVETLEAGKDAVRNHDWETAVESLTRVDDEVGLSPDDLMLLGDACWWSSQPERAVEVFERAFNAYVKEDQIGEAGTVGAMLAYFAFRRMAFSVGMGWMARVEKLLDGQPESKGHAWLKILHAASALFFESDLDKVIEAGDEAIEIAQRQGMVGPQALGMSFKGIAKTARGEWREGMALVDEASALAMSRGDDLRASSDVYCNMMGVCSTLGDYRRAREWTDEAERWMRSHSLGGFTGVCQVHRAELKRLRGAWSEAERDARVACTELERFHLLNGLGFANYEIGEVRRRMGDLDAAEEAFVRAYEYGHPAQPGLALLRMDQGDLEAAMKSIDGALGGLATPAGSPNYLNRGHLLPTQVEIAIAAGDHGKARESLKELREIAAMYDAPMWEATSLTCEGALELAEGDTGTALGVLDKAWRLWQEIDLPYETARARELLGRARMASGDTETAELEFRAARSAYQHLGARTDLSRLEEVLDVPGADPAVGERLTRTFMFTDIVTSTDLIGLIGDEAWERLLAWHDRELRKAINEHQGDEVRHTGDGFFVAFNSPRSAIDCGVAIQRQLHEHRLQHGFAPTVRIGIHIAEATRHRDDYSGAGVHVASRIGDLGAGGELVVSSDLLKAAGPIPQATFNPREVELKGVAEPVLVYNIDWQT